MPASRYSSTGCTKRAPACLQRPRPLPPAAVDCTLQETKSKRVGPFTPRGRWEPAAGALGCGLIIQHGALRVHVSLPRVFRLNQDACVASCVSASDGRGRWRFMPGCSSFCKAASRVCASTASFEGTLFGLVGRTSLQLTRDVRRAGTWSLARVLYRNNTSAARCSSSSSIQLVAV